MSDRQELCQDRYRFHVLAAVRCWGNGASGQLGYGVVADVGVWDTPADVGDVPAF